MFRFKQFSVEDDRSTMKVGTDAVLLGASAGLGLSHSRILDIGTGCGVVALMMAQQFSEATIDAIDIDLPSVEQATENFAASPWSGRLHARHSALQAYHAEPYDLIVSNPPYFTDSLRNTDPRRARARHSDALPLPELLSHSLRLLAPHGRITTILPLSESQRLEELAHTAGLHTLSTLLVRNREDLPPKRRILTLCTSQFSPLNSQFSILNSQLTLTTPTGERTPEHRRLTDMFYL